MGRGRLLGAGLVLAAVVAASAVASSGPAELRPLRLVAPAKEPGPLLGVVSHHRAAWLARIDASTMRMIGRPALKLGLVGSWGYSPDGGALALAARGYESSPDMLRFVDPQSLRPTGRSVPLGAQARTLAWLTPDRIVALTATCCDARTTLVRVDPVARRVVGREPIADAAVEGIARAGDSLVLLLAPLQRIGPARLVVVGADASRTVALPEVIAGSVWDESTNPPLGTQRRPGLTVDPAGSRAFVITPERLVAEIDLRTLAVGYHQLGRPASLLARVAEWLEPAAQAKGMDGPERTARWLGDGQIAVAGSDWSVSVHKGSMRMSVRPSGLEIVDTTDWTAHTLDPHAAWFTVADGLVLATGAAWSNEGDDHKIADGIGVTGYGADGRRRFQLFDGTEAWVAQAYGNRAYVGVSDVRRLRVVDLGTGTVTGERDGNLPWLLLGAQPDS